LLSRLSRGCNVQVERQTLRSNFRPRDGGAHNSAKATDDALLPPSTRGADTPPAGGMDDDINRTNVV
jgi:hypothetical protein